MILPAIAGILAAIGTGVDDQIIITDEVLKKGVATKRTATALKFKINNAFFIIFASAATLIAAMLPLAYVGITRGVHRNRCSIRFCIYNHYRCFDRNILNKTSIC